MPQRRTQSGFTYLAALFLLAIMGAVLASVGVVWQTVRQREQERELLFVGAQFRTAIRQYYEQTPGPSKQYPKTLAMLINDTRHAGLRRHLRRIYVDPMTNSTEWGLLKTEQGEIKGVFSLTKVEALKTENFLPQDRDFTGKVLVSEWQFYHGEKLARPKDGKDAKPGTLAPANSNSSLPASTPALPKIPAATEPAPCLKRFGC